ncbi:hypothetical protein MMC17_010115 [Xylographa soralifera]|nr:hypothetical protein [Xylographa soralifera]
MDSSGADDGTTQSDLELNNDSATDESSDSEEDSTLSFESVRLKHPIVERPEHVIENTPAPISTTAAAATPEAPDSEFVELGLRSSKKSKKKSKISTARAVFEEE